MNADPEVMEYFPSPLPRAETEARFERIKEHFKRHGFGIWAVEEKATGNFLGWLGLMVPAFAAPFTPCVEIGWRLKKSAWGKGYATEAAFAALEYGFLDLDLEEIVSFTVPDNFRSIRVMEKLGMSHSSKDDFDHPLIEEGHPLRRHVLYRLKRAKYLSSRGLGEISSETTH